MLSASYYWDTSLEYFPSLQMEIPVWFLYFKLQWGF